MADGQHQCSRAIRKKREVFALLAGGSSDCQETMDQSTNPIHPSQDNQYILELGDHDVLCGRGSGPNDRRGNIEFRNLIMLRKVDYLSAPTRDAKGKIAKSIVETVRMRGGRFVRKLNAAEVEKAGFAKGTAVFEMADEPTGELMWSR